MTAFGKYGIFDVNESNLHIVFLMKWIKSRILFSNPLRAFTYNETYTKLKIIHFSFHLNSKHEGWNLPVTTHEV
jgi:hypothetical protein